jgi:hypothetical protein
MPGSEQNANHSMCNWSAWSSATSELLRNTMKIRRIALKGLGPKIAHLPPCLQGIQSQH